MPVPAKDSTLEVSALSELEIESIELFIGFFKLIGLQKSVGEIYGLLFVSPRAVDSGRHTGHAACPSDG
jgi:hypothetical protein